jgi:hypothetical protein
MGLMRRTLERLQIDSRAIWDGCSAHAGRRRIGDLDADIEHLDEPDNITVWLIPNPTESQAS